MSENTWQNDKLLPILGMKWGWGLKNIHVFGISLAAKTLWNPITKESLWKRIVVQKYIAPSSILD
jgi:hypothetical protein